MAERIFDSTCEVSKQVVREIFRFGAQSVDGLAASILHIAQEVSINRLTEMIVKVSAKMTISSNSLDRSIGKHR